MYVFLFYFNGIEYRFVNVERFKSDWSENLEILVPGFFTRFENLH